MAYILIPAYIKESLFIRLFQLEETSITSFGVQLKKRNRFYLLSSIGLVSACVAVSGSIGFIGLMAPHIAKRLVGIQHHYVIPSSGVIGMFLVIVSDFIAKTVFHTCRIPVGIVISIVGVPYFLYLLIRRKHKRRM